MEVQIDRVTGTASVNRAGHMTVLDIKTYEGQVAFALALQQLKDLAFIAWPESRTLGQAA